MATRVIPLREQIDVHHMDDGLVIIEQINVRGGENSRVVLASIAWLRPILHQIDEEDMTTRTIPLREQIEVHTNKEDRTIVIEQINVRGGANNRVVLSSMDDLSALVMILEQIEQESATAFYAAERAEEEAAAKAATAKKRVGVDKTKAKGRSN